MRVNQRFMAYSPFLSTALRAKVPGPLAIFFGLTLGITDDLFAQQGKLMDSAVGKSKENFNVIDARIFSNQGGSANDFYVVAGAFGLIIVIMILMAIFRNIRASLVNQRLSVYRTKKTQSKMAALNMSDDAAEALSRIAKGAGFSAEELITDNRIFESSANELKASNPSDPALKFLQSIREQSDFLFGNPKVAFVCSQMLEIGQKVRIFVEHQGKGHSFLSSVLRVTESELWVRPPKVKGKTINLTLFKKFEIRVYRPEDGEYHFFSSLRRQITKPVHALILDHGVQVLRMNHRKQERVAVEIEKKVAYMVAAEDSKFSFGDIKALQVSQTVVDLSAGGMMTASEGLPAGVQAGTSIVTTLGEAGIKQKVYGKVMRIDQEEGNSLAFIHIMFTRLSERNRHLLDKFVVALKKSGGKPPQKTKVPPKHQTEETLVPEGESPDAGSIKPEQQEASPLKPNQGEALPQAEEAEDLDLRSEDLDLDLEPDEEDEKL